MPRFAPILLAFLVLGEFASTPPPADAMAVAAAPAKAAKLQNRRKIRALLRRHGLAQLPSIAQAITGGGGRAALAAAVVGTPPALVDIPDVGATALFWQPGVLDAIVAGTASPDQCGQFWSGMHDGDSGGMGACHMAEGVGYSFGNILSGEGSLCYMKRFPTRDNVDAGALTLVAGAFPGDDPTKLFSVPPGRRTRVVKVDATGQQHGDEAVFLRVHGAATNRADGNLYAVDLWFCPPAGGQPRGYDRIRIATSGEYAYAEGQMEEGDGGSEVHVSSVRGYVSFADGVLTWDTTRSRHAGNASSRSDGSWWSDTRVDPDDTIASKQLDSWGGGTHASYIVSAFSGSSLDDLRFRAGAFKETDSQSDRQFVGGTEFRSTYYAAAPDTDLVSRLDEVDLSSDAFYTAPAPITVDVSSYACDATPDVEVALDFTHPAARAIQDACENRVWDRMHFCHDDATVRAAEMAFATSCMRPQ